MEKFRIRDWNEHFESSKSREYEKCGKAAFPNKMDGFGMSRLLAEPDGSMMYGVFHMLVSICSRQQKPRDGWLTVDGTETGAPLSAEDISVMIRRPVVEVRRTCDFLTTSAVKWLEVHGQQTGSRRTVDGQSAGSPRTSTTPSVHSTSVHSTPIPPSGGSVSKPQESKPTAWGIWIDVNKEAGRPEPVALGPDTSAAQRFMKALGPEEFKRRCASYLKDNATFLQAKGHALQFMAPNKYAARQAVAFPEVQA